MSAVELLDPFISYWISGEKKQTPISSFKFEKKRFFLHISEKDLFARNAEFESIKTKSKTSK